MQIAKRWFTILLGLVITVIGLILMPVPGPGGTPVTLAGLAILSTQLPWAKKLRERFIQLLDSRVMRKPWVRAGAIVGALGFYTFTSFLAYKIFLS